MLLTITGYMKPFPIPISKAATTGEMLVYNRKFWFMSQTLQEKYLQEKGIVKGEILRLAKKKNSGLKNTPVAHNRCLQITQGPTRLLVYKRKLQITEPYVLNEQSLKSEEILFHTCHYTTISVCIRHVQYNTVLRQKARAIQHKTVQGWQSKGRPGQEGM